MDKKNKRTLVFDFGNVLINLDFKACFDALDETLEVKWSENGIPPDIQDAIASYDKGYISDADFITALKKYNDAASDEAITRAWNKMLLDIPMPRLEMLLSLREEYRVALLSNTNNIHINHVHRILESTHGIRDFEQRYFDHVFYSHQIGLRKPELPIFIHVADRMKAEPSDILFIDDMKVNVIAAKSQDWSAVVHPAERDIVTELPRYLQFYGFDNG